VGKVLGLRSCVVALAAVSCAEAQTAQAAERRVLTAALNTPVRRTAANEAAVLEACREFVRAQFEYFAFDHAGDGFLSFAARIRSTPGRHDGLYWPIDTGDDESPIGPNFAAAAPAELSPEVSPRPYFGYYFKALVAQGPDAPGGARDYRVNGRLIGGFALIAWPAEYGVTGTVTFQVNQLGIVYRKDLGPDTSRAAGIAEFSPDSSWTRIPFAREAGENH